MARLSVWGPGGGGRSILPQFAPNLKPLFKKVQLKRTIVFKINTNNKNKSAHTDWAMAEQPSLFVQHQISGALCTSFVCKAVIEVYLHFTIQTS